MRREEIVRAMQQIMGPPPGPVLCLHPTDDKIAHRVVVDRASKPNRQYAAELAERRYVALGPSYPLLAARPQGAGPHPILMLPGRLAAAHLRSC